MTEYLHDDNDPELVAARRHCAPGCPGPTLLQLSGLAPPHRCDTTVAEAFAGDHLATTAELHRQREQARDVATQLEQELAHLTALAREVVGDHCQAHTGHVETCDVCLLVAWLNGGAPAELADAIEALRQPVVGAP